MKIVAGIDFGTSMSMIQTLDHDGCEQEMTECKTVRFTQSAQAATPTLVRVEEETGYEWFGEEAQNVNKGVMYENFKLALRSEDPQERQRARDLVERFFRYLYACYKEEKNKLYPGANSAQEETVVGHPVQWDEAQRSIILDAARKADFKNVRGKDEASASVLCVMTHNQEALRRAGYLQKGKPLNIMVLDMGAGTTDLAFVQVTEKDGGVDIQQQGTWPPKDYPEVFGGSRIDKVLADRMTDWLNACSLPASLTEQFIKGNYLSLKNWKEYNVSSDLEKNLTVDSCTALGMAMNMVQYMPGVTAAPFPAFGRTEYEEMMAEELGIFVRTIQSAPKELREQTDLVFVTGGNSQWYWVPEILSGEKTRFGDVGLPKIKGNLQAIQKTTYPTETVSRGLVYMGKGIRFAEAPKVEVRKAETPKTEDHSQLNDRLVSALKQAADAKAAAPNVESRKTAAPKATAPKADENIFTAWREKRAKAPYPDMKMMERLYMCNDVAMAVSDSGRVLSTKQSIVSQLIGKYDPSQLREIDAILGSEKFRRKDGRIVDSKGKVLSETGPYLAKNEVFLIDQNGRVCINTQMINNESTHLTVPVLGGDEAVNVLQKARSGVTVDALYPLKCWKQPLEKLMFMPFLAHLGGTPEVELARKHAIVDNKSLRVDAFVGLTREGELACRRPEMIEYLHHRYPALTLNPNGTLGENIIDIKQVSENLFILKNSGELCCCYHQGKIVSMGKDIAHIGFHNHSVGIWAIDESGNLYRFHYKTLAERMKLPASISDRYNTYGNLLMTDCIAAYCDRHEIIAMDKNGKVSYVNPINVSKKYQSEVASWNIHDV